ncbi:MAG: hypothetical protein IPJ71_01340 [Bdellovibrionales bacterium]|nr:hypothetical protein [Bdellovibrionales bacterium]
MIGFLSNKWHLNCKRLLASVFLLFLMLVFEVLRFKHQLGLLKMVLWRFPKILGLVFFCWSHQAHAGFVLDLANTLGLVRPHKSICLAFLKAGEKLDRLEKSQVSDGLSGSGAISSRAFTLNSFRTLKSRLGVDPESVLNRGYARISSRGEVLRGSMDKLHAASRLNAVIVLSDRKEDNIIVAFSSQNREKLSYAIDAIAREMQLTPLGELGWRSIFTQIQDFLTEPVSGTREYLMVSESAQFSRDIIGDSGGVVTLSASSQGGSQGSSIFLGHSDMLIERDPDGEVSIHLLIQYSDGDPQFPARGRRKIIGGPEMDLRTPVPNGIPSKRD